METNTRYFTIKSPDPSFTGRVGAVSFADGVARVSFDDTRDEDGRSVAEEHQVHVGRSAVMFARRRKGYEVIETDMAGVPLSVLAEQEAEAKAKGEQEAEAAKKAAEDAAADAAAKKAAAAAKGGAK